MKVYLAKDWTGSHTFIEPPKLLPCGGMPDIWSGHKLPFSIEDDIPRGKFKEIVINITK